VTEYPLQGGIRMYCNSRSTQTGQTVSRPHWPDAQCVLFTHQHAVWTGLFSECHFQARGKEKIYEASLQNAAVEVYN